jgi:peptidylprolyl isomerase
MRNKAFLILIGILICNMLIFANVSCQPSENETEAEEQAAEEQAAEQPEEPAQEGIPQVKGDTVTTKTGLKYIDYEIGKGEKVKAGDRASVHYTGWLTDGKKFDSSRDRNQPFLVEVGAGRVIPGWDEGLQGIAVGGKRMLIIPSTLGYGSRAMGPIPANSDLIFDVEVLEIKEPPKIPAYKESDVQKTSTGLGYVILTEGTGPAPQKGQNVTVHYTGWLTSGKLFDSSVERGVPFNFVLGAGRVIKGWDEGVAMMKEGEKRLLIIPPELAYGSRERPGIPANSTLIFEVELIDVPE